VPSPDDVTHFLGIFSTASEPHTGQRNFFREKKEAKTKTITAIARIVIIKVIGKNQSKILLPSLKR
jgi:hypothetical protein